MKRLLVFAVLALAACTRPACAGELKILEPVDHSIVRGDVKLRVQPVLAPGERLLASPVMSLKDEAGTEIRTLDPIIDRKTGIFAAELDTSRMKDGLYLVTSTYRVLRGARDQTIAEDLKLGVRNGASRPAKFEVVAEDKPFKPDDTCEVTVKVYDQRGKLMPAARVAFKTNKGSVDSDAEITDSDGEALTTVDTDETEDVTLTITVEGLPPVTRVFHFVE